MTQAGPRIGMVAGEASGDLLASLLLGGMRARWPGLQTYGIGGPRMAAHGFEAWWPHDKLAVRGYVEVLRHYREIAGIRRRLEERLVVERPDAFIGVDAPDFNLELEGRLKARGIASIHFVSPSIWAWRGKRVHKVGRATDLVLCLFPFEPALYERHGIPARYVGHPLADAIPLEPPRDDARRALGIGTEETVVALLPGSRRSEVDMIAPAFLEAASRMHARRAGLRFLLPAAPGMNERLAPMVARHAPAARIDRLTGRSQEALAACDVAVVASGTATLEAALFKRPMVIAYRMNPISWEMMKRMQLQPWVGLPNILLRDFAVPELIQSKATPDAIADETLRWLAEPAAVRRLEARFADMHLQLRCDTARAATDAIAQTIDR